MRKIISICVLCLICLWILPKAVAEDNGTAVEIRTAQELAAMDKEGSYVLAADIDLAEIEWQPMEFNGTLDGNGHTLYNLTVKSRADFTDVTIDGNHKKYDTELVGLFSKNKGAHISNLNIRGAYIEYTTETNAFASIVAAISDNSVYENIFAEGRVFLYTGGKMGGVAGIVGFGTGKILDSSADVTLVYVDTNTAVKCEQFLAGANACGYMDVKNFVVKMNGYASVHGYVHNGGVIGMHHNHDANYKKNTVSGCYATGQITFFEHNNDRRAYCKGIIGEKLNDSLTVENNTVTNFSGNETKNYKENLMPEMCENPDIMTATVEATPYDAGYTIHSCMNCGYTYRTDYKLMPQ